MKDKLTICYSATLQDGELPQSFLNADVILIGNKTFGTVDFKTELSGKTSKLAEISGLSKKVNATVFVALKTNNYGAVRRSVAVFENGKLLSIADATLISDASETTSFGYKIIKTKTAKFGIAVGADFTNLDCLKTLSLCESDAIINLYADFYDFSRQNFVQAVAYLLKVPTVSLGEKCCVAALSSGVLINYSEENSGSFILPVKKNFKEITVKLRG